MSDYLADVRRYVADADEGKVAAIVKYLGVALYGKDSSLVSCSDPKELARVQNGFCKKKLGLEAAAAEAAILQTCETMNADRQKHRVTFYYLLALKSGTLARL